jgi:hypothetical protein
MRTKTLLLTAALSVAGIATSMAQAVYSVNAVGYVNTPLLPGFNLISNPLDNKSSATGNTIQNLFGTGVQGTIPDGMIVYYFNATTDSFVSATYDSLDSAFLPAANAGQVVPPGEGVFVFVPGSQNVTVTFVGEVPQAAASNQQLPAGFSIKASTVPIAGNVNELAFPAAPGDIIYEWDPVQDKYVSNSFDDIDNAWLPSVPNIAVGEAFFLFKNAPTTWTRNFTVNQ